jgi:outer membrane receptor for ferrienterochelin and colicins
LIAFLAASCLTSMGQNAASPKSAQPPDDSSTSLESLLQTKVVTASRFSENLAGAPGMMTVVSRGEIERFGGLSLREILSRVSGLDLSTSIFSDHTIVTVRGDQAKATGVHVLFLINGRPTREVLEGGVMTELLEAFPVGILERIEVIEGPGSVLYGSNAFSGVINLITRKAEGRSGAVRGYGTGAGPSGGSAEGLYRRGDFSLVGAAQFRQESRWNTPIWPLGFPNESRQTFPLYNDSRAIFAEATYKGLTLMASAMESRSPYEVTGSIGENRWRRTFADAGYDFQPRAHWEMGLHATYTGTGLDSSAYPIVNLKGREVELDWTNSIEFSERTRMTFGTLYSFQHGRSDSIIDGLTTTVTAASRPGGGFYVQLEHRLTDELKLIGGFQTNKVENVPVHTVPRAGVMWNVHPHWFVKALYGQAFRAPSLNETRIQDPSVLGNSRLLPELASTFDLGIIYQANRLQTSINYFRYKEVNEIEPVAIGPSIFKYQNAGEIRMAGFQWESKYYFRPRFLAEGSVLYQTNVDETGFRQYLPTPGFGAKAGVSYADKQGWTIGLFDVYSGLVPAFASTPNPKPSAHHLLTAHVRLGLEKYLGPSAKRVAIFAHGDNLANRPVWQPAWGYGSSTTQPVERGRTIYYGLEFSFKRE